MPWTFREETGFFPFLPLTFFSFPSLRPLFLSQKPFLPITPLPAHFSFLKYPSFTLSLATRLSTQHRSHALTSPLTPTQLSHFLILFLVFVLSLPSTELFSLPLCAYHRTHCSHTLLPVWSMEDALSMSPHSVPKPYTMQ